MDNPVVSFDGLHNNFLFVNGDANLGNFNAGLMMIPLFNSATDYAQIFYGPRYTADVDPDANISTRWNLQIATAVAEPEAYAMLLTGLGLVGFAARRRGIAARNP